MKIRYWFLAVGTAIALVALLATDPTDWSDIALLFGGGLVGIWASEGAHAHAEARGIKWDPL